MEKFIHIKCSLADKGRIIPFVKEDIEKYTFSYTTLFGEKDKELDWYSSLYYFPKEAVDYFDSHIDENGAKSLKGYNGPGFSNRLFFDLDKKDEIEVAKNDVIKLLGKLIDKGINVQECTRVYYSGNKGFHIEVFLDTELTQPELKQICTNLGEDLDSFDPVIYNITRTIRMANTVHKVSGLYKTELDLPQLENLSIEEIKELAKNPTNHTWDIIPCKNLDFINELKKSINKPKQVIVSIDDNDEIRGMKDINFENCPRNKPRCIHALEHGVMVSGIGERNQLLLRLTAYYRSQGMPQEATYSLLKGVIRQNAELYPDKEPFEKTELYTLVNSCYSSSNFKVIPGSFGSSADNELLKKYCDAAGKYTNKPCCYHGKKAKEENAVIRIDDVLGSFTNFAENVDKNTVKTGIKFIDQHMKIMTSTTTVLVGATGSSKTSLSLNVLQNANESELDSVFFSLDMNSNQIYLKLAKMLTDYTDSEIFRFFATKNTVKIEEIKNIISKKFSRTYFNFSKTLTLEQMRDFVFDIEQKTGNKVKFTLVDYFSRISGPYQDAHANANYNALKSIEMCEATDSAWILLSQISRQTGDGCTPIRTKRAAKDSGSIEESAQNVITMWRPYMGHSECDDVIRLFLAKNRMGRELEALLHWNASKGLVRDMTDQEVEDYESTRGKKAEKAYLESRKG